MVFQADLPTFTHIVLPFLWMTCHTLLYDCPIHTTSGLGCTRCSGGYEYCTAEGCPIWTRRPCHSCQYCMYHSGYSVGRTYITSPPLSLSLSLSLCHYLSPSLSFSGGRPRPSAAITPICTHVDTHDHTHARNIASTHTRKHTHRRTYTPTNDRTHSHTNTRTHRETKQTYPGWTRMGMIAC